MERNSTIFLTLLEAHKGILYKIANAYCRNNDQRKDLVQEIILQLWMAFPKYREEYQVSTWIYRIVLNVSITYYRKENRRKGINEPLPEELVVLQETSQAVALEAQVAQLYHFIRELKELDRAIMLLYLEEKSQAEIAEILGLSATNVSTKVYRIKEQLKKHLQTIQA